MARASPSSPRRAASAPNAPIRFPPIRPPCHLADAGRASAARRPCDHAPMARDDHAGAQAPGRGGVRRAPGRARRRAPTAPGSGRRCSADRSTRPAARSRTGGSVLPMEGWDGTPDGRPDRPRPSAVAPVRAQRRGAWSGVARRSRSGPTAGRTRTSSRSGRESVGDLAELRDGAARGTRRSHRRRSRAADRSAAHALGPVVAPERHARAPQIAFRHPILDAVVGAGDASVVTDGWLDDLVGAYAAAAVVARRGRLRLRRREALPRLPAARAAGRARPTGPVRRRPRRAHALPHRGGRARSGGDAPGLQVGVRLSAFDVVPHVRGADGRGVPATSGPYRVRVRW